MTAVEWLIEQLPTIDKYDPYYAYIIKQAKEMEKQKIMDAWVNGGSTLSTKNAEQYYNETYKSE